MDKIPTAVVDGERLGFAAALCLLHLDKAGVLKPIAIQVRVTYRLIDFTI